MLESYTLKRPIGQGGMAVVWLAERDGDFLALKFATGVRTEFGRRAFRREAQAAASLSHPSVVQMLDFGLVPPGGVKEDSAINEGAPWMALEWVPEGALRPDAITDWPSLRACLAQVLGGLAHAHARGIIHRDIKPENILGTIESGMRLTDFGIAGIVDHGASARVSGPTAGTPWAMAPEQFLGSARMFGPWTDIYGLGCVAWRIATGEVPFTAPNALALALKHTQQELPAFVPRFEVPASFEGWLRRCLAKPPLTRFRDAVAARQALKNCDSSGARLGRPEGEQTVELLDDQPTLPWFSRTSADLVSPLRHVAPRAVTTLPVDPPVDPGDWRSLPTAGTHEQASVSLLPLRAVQTTGRREQRDALWGLWRRAIEEQTMVVAVLRGPRGAGKTHLARWLSTAAHERCGAKTTLATHGLQQGPDEGVNGMMRRYIRCHHLHGDSLAQRIRGVLDAYGQQDEALVSGLTNTLDEGANALPMAAPDRYRILGSFIELTVTVWQRPGLLVFDDCLLSADSTRFVRHLVEALGDGLPLMVVVTVDDEDASVHATSAAVIDQLSATSVHVARMTREEHGALLRDLAVDGRTAHDIYSWTDGLPLHAMSLAHDLATRGAIAEDGVHLDPGGDLASHGDHTTWRLGQTRRALANLEFADDAVLSVRLAAVLGSHVDREEWMLACEALDLRVAADDVVDALIEAGLALHHHGDWRFAHRTIHEDLLVATNASEQRALHQAALTAINERYAGLSALPWQRLATHHEALGQVDETLFAYRKAVDLLTATGRRPEAVDIADRVDALTATFGDDDPRGHLGALLRLRAQIYYMESVEDLQPLEATVAKAEEHGWPEIELLAREVLAVGLSSFNRYRQAGVHFKRALELVDMDRDAPMAARLLHGQGIELGRRGDRRQGRQRMTEAIEVARGCGDLRRVASVQLGLAEFDVAEGNADAAEARVKRALPTLVAFAALVVLGDAYNELGEIARFRGDFDGALHHYEQARFYYDEAKASDVHVAQFNRSMVALHLGQWEEAREAFDGLATYYRSRELGFDLATALMGKAVALARLGVHDELAPLVQEASLLMGENAQETDVALLWQWLAEALVGTDQKALLEQAVGLCVQSWLSLGNPVEAATVRAKFGVEDQRQSRD